MDEFPEHLNAAIYFVAESIAEVAEKLNKLIGRTYHDEIGNGFYISYIRHFHVERIEEWYVLPEEGPAQAHIAYEVIALPVYESLPTISFRGPSRGEIGELPDTD